jgi:hypothetical protein
VLTKDLQIQQICRSDCLSSCDISTTISAINSKVFRTTLLGRIYRRCRFWVFKISFRGYTSLLNSVNFHFLRAIKSLSRCEVFNRAKLLEVNVALGVNYRHSNNLIGHRIQSSVPPLLSHIGHLCLVAFLFRNGTCRGIKASISALFDQPCRRKMVSPCSALKGKALTIESTLIYLSRAPMFDSPYVRCP